MDKISLRMEQEKDILARLSNRHNEFYDKFLGLGKVQASGVLNRIKKAP